MKQGSHPIARGAIVRYIPALLAIAAMLLACGPSFAAMNPFMDVPASHWAYDAIAQLAARGVISGYPDGTYKGARPTTRYEMASALARALAKIDMEKASKQDVEMLKRLIVEFKDELDALGVKVDRLDSRVAVLEKNIGGWSMSGQMRLDWKIGNSNGFYTDPINFYMRGKNEMDLNRYRFWIRKRINETTSFTARLGRQPRNGTGGSPVQWEHYFITVALSDRIKMNVGRNDIVDYERELRLMHVQQQPWFGNWTAAGFHFFADWGGGKGEFFLGRTNDNTGLPAEDTNPFTAEKYILAGRAHFDFNERFMGGVMAYWLFSNGDEKEFPLASGGTEERDTNTLTAGVYLGYKFTPAVALRGIYYHQKQGDYYGIANGTGDDKAKAWKIMLDINQEALKFTSLWLEYGQMDNNFDMMESDQQGHATEGPYSDIAHAGYMANILRPHSPSVPGTRWLQKGNAAGTSKVIFVRADQKWNPKWRSFLFYGQVDYDTDNWDKAKQWGLGVAYRLNPAVEFELGFERVDYGNVAREFGYDDESDHILRLRTFVTF